MGAEGLRRLGLEAEVDFGLSETGVDELLKIMRFDRMAKHEYIIT